MYKLWVIARKDINEAFRSRSTYVFIIVILVLSFTFFQQYNRVVNSLTNQQVIIDQSRIFINGLAYTLPLMFSIFVCSIFANYSVIVDKAKRNIESLMATPISIKQLWMGKSLAVTLPSIGIGISVSILDYLVVNFGFVIPKTDTFIFPSALAIVSALIIVPLMIFAIVTIVLNIQLIISNPRIANLVFTGIFLLVFFGISAVGSLNISADFLTLIYLGGTVLFGCVSLILSRSLTKEKVLLSSKI